MSEVLLEVKDLSVAFRQGGKATLAVDHVSFSLKKGETLALVGESGSGKSVSALSILKLLPYPAAEHPSGSVRFKGQELLDADESDLRKVRGNDITMIFQGTDHQPAQQGGHPRSRDATAGLSAPAFRRAAAARYDRHGAGQQSRPAHCR
jgi:ABC-type microcin C transport system duplicated ATPase subunit YejF